MKNAGRVGWYPDTCGIGVGRGEFGSVATLASSVSLLCGCYGGAPLAVQYNSSPSSMTATSWLSTHVSCCVWLQEQAALNEELNAKVAQQQADEEERRQQQVSTGLCVHMSSLHDR